MRGRRDYRHGLRALRQSKGVFNIRLCIGGFPVLNMMLLGYISEDWKVSYAFRAAPGVVLMAPVIPRHIVHCGLFTAKTVLFRLNPTSIIQHRPNDSSLYLHYYMVPECPCRGKGSPTQSISRQSLFHLYIYMFVSRKLHQIVGGLYP